MESPSSQAEPVGDPALRVADLGWGVGGLKIIDGVDLSIGQGEFVSVIGPNGAGKTSLINLISGFYQARSGVIELLGTVVTNLRPALRTRRGLGRTFQTSSLFPTLTVSENVRLAAQSATGGSLNLLAIPKDQGEVGEQVTTALELVNLTSHRSDRVRDLSHGDKRKLELAVVLAGNPQVLLLDEPTAGVSVEETRPLVELIRRVHSGGKTVLMVEHRMEFVVDVSDRIAVMHEGRLLTIDSPERVMADKIVRKAYLGEGL